MSFDKLNILFVSSFPASPPPHGAQQRLFLREVLAVDPAFSSPDAERRASRGERVAHRPMEARRGHLLRQQLWRAGALGGSSICQRSMAWITRYHFRFIISE
jgi:hypothetical protein